MFAFDLDDALFYYYYLYVYLSMVDVGRGLSAHGMNRRQ